MVEKDAVREGYDGVAEAYAARRSFDDREREILERFLASLPADATVLDAGCGRGEPVLGALSGEAPDAQLPATRPDSRPIGLDISREQVRLAAEHAPGAAVLRGDLTRIPVADGAVDAVVAFHSLIHVPADQHGDAIGEFARVLRPGGRVLLSEGVEPWEGRNPDWLGTGVEMQWHIAGAETTGEQIGEAGLAVETERVVSDVLVDGEEWAFFEAVLPG